MKPNRFDDCDDLPSPQVLDAALRAFWRGSARPIDRLAGGTGDVRPRLGELLLLLLDSAGTARPARTCGSK